MRLRYVLWLLVLFLNGCATFSTAHFQAEGAKASALCIKGGYAMAGGTVTGAKVNEDFRGSVVVQPDCSIAITSDN